MPGASRARRSAGFFAPVGAAVGCFDLLGAGHGIFSSSCLVFGGWGGGRDVGRLEPARVCWYIVSRMSPGESSGVAGIALGSSGDLVLHQGGAARRGDRSFSRDRYDQSSSRDQTVSAGTAARTGSHVLRLERMISVD